MDAFRRWLLRGVLLAPAYWIARDAVRLQLSDYLSLVVVPWAILVVASWLAPARVLAPHARSTRLVFAVIAVLCAWGALHTARLTTRVVLLPSLLAAAATVVPSLAVAAIALALTLGAIELALRVRPVLLPVEVRQALPLDTRARLACFFRTPDGCLPADALQLYPPTLAFAYRPHLDVVLWHPESGFWTLRTDARGFPNRQPSLYTAADAVVLGDSFMQGVLVEPEESFAARLAAETGRAVLNLGVAGWDAYQYPVALRQHGLAARPRVVIAALFGTNDWNARFPHFVRFRAAHPGHDYRDFLEEQARARRGAGPVGLFGLPERLYRAAFLPAAVGTMLDTRAAGSGYDEILLAGRAVRVRLVAALRLWRAIDPERLMAEHAEGIAQLERSIAELRALADEARSRLVVLYVPTMEEVYLPLLDAASPLWGATRKADLLAKFARLQAVVRERVPASVLLDLTPSLQEVARGGEQLYWISDPHWNRRGNQAVAGIVARHLARR